jgi:prolipoprotein diacylglyceryltransferase
MTDEFFVLSMSICFGLLLTWAFKSLPQEQWQILASLPISKDMSDKWTGVNFTYYGLFTAFATVSAVSVVFLLLGSVHISVKLILIFVGTLFSICLPAARVIARVVEKKPQTLTIGGASFVGFLAAPLIAWVLSSDSALGPYHVPPLPLLAAISIAYALGEGLGRLACISFGCCYGKPLTECHPWIGKAIGSYTFVFSGKSKKIAYERGLDGKHVVPIQAITSVLYVAVSLAGILLYLKGFYSTSLVLTITVTQLWRVLSEMLRADYRGEGKLSMYQIMALIAIFCGWVTAFAFREVSLPPADLRAGIVSMWDPAVLLFLQLLGLTTFVYTGRSMVTGSTLSFHVIKERI